MGEVAQLLGGYKALAAKPSPTLFLHPKGR